MKQIAYPAGIREAASRMGCDLGTHAKFGADYLPRGKTTAWATPKDTATNTSPAFTRPNVESYAPPLSSGPKGIVTGKAAQMLDQLRQRQQTVTVAPDRGALANKAIVLPTNINPTTAIAVADRLLNTPAAKPVVERTLQIAALPDAAKVDINPDAIAAIERAAATIDAAAKIREVAQVPPDQPLVPVQTADQSAAVESATTTYALSDSDLEALATATQQMVESARHHGPLERFLDWLKRVLT